MGNFRKMFNDYLKNAGRAAAMRIIMVALFVTVAVDVATLFFLREAPALIVPASFNGSSTPSAAGTAAWAHAAGPRGHMQPDELHAHLDGSGWLPARDELGGWLEEEEGYDDEFGSVSWAWKDLLANLDDFDGDTVDLCLLLPIRWAVLIVLLLIGRRVTTKEPAPCRICQPCWPQPSPAERTAPLLINDGATVEVEPATASHEADRAHVKQYEISQRIQIKKNILSAVIFATSTTAQVYIGVKVIDFRGYWDDDGDAAVYATRIKTVQGILFFLQVLLINFETFAANSLLGAMDMDDGFLVPEIHQHRLFFTKKDSHVCDLCRDSVSHVYRCDTCDFDVCPACFNKKDKATGEGVMRGDKGVKSAVVLGRLDYFWRCMRLIAPYSTSFIFALVCLMLQSVASLVMPNFQGEIFNHIIDALNTCSDDMHSSTCHKHRQGFFHFMGLYAGLSAALGFIVALRTLAFQIVARQINFGTRKTLFKNAMQADIAFFDGMRTGDIQARLDRDITSMVWPIRTALSTILSNLTLLIGALIMCFITSWRLSMLAFVTILPMMHITTVYAEWSRKLNQAMNQHVSDSLSRCGEAINNIRTVRACSAESTEVETNNKTVNRALLAGIKDAVGAGLAAALNDYLELGAGVLILWYGGSMAMDPSPGHIKVGHLIAYQLYWNIINTAVQALNDNVTAFTRAAGAAERVLSLYDLKPDIDPDSGSHVDTVVSRWSLTFEDVEFHYQMRPNLKVLCGMSFDVPAGKVGALVGRSGGGKSTMIHLLLRFYDPRAGCIRLGGVDLRDINVRSMHKYVGVVSQETQMFNGTIGENLAYGIDEPSQEEIEVATKAAQCYDFINSFEDGMRTRVGERGQRLSGGQKQRIAIARCLLRKPRLLLLDEATSALDAESEAQVQKALDAMIWSGEKTVMLVAHRLSTVINSHTIIVVDKGRAAEQGNHEELMARQGTYASLVAYQLRKASEQLSETADATDGIDALFDAQSGGKAAGGASSSSGKNK